MAKAMGVDLTSPNGDRRARPELIPNFTLGVANASPLEMAEAYATFAARGLHCDSRPVTEILDSAKNLVREYPAKCNQVMEESTADAVNDVLRGVIEGGFASARRSTSRPPARPAPRTRASRSGSSATPRSSPQRR